MSSAVTASTINPLGLSFTNRFTRDLPADPVQNNSPRQVHGACFSRVDPTPTAAPILIAHSPDIADQLGLTSEQVASAEFTAIFSGNLVTADMDPYAMCYGGHQFGSWAGQLGDGRAIALGEILATDGTHQTLQLKGSGPTPYSRTADGRAVLRSSIREFLCSEAMFHLGVPTTRALSLTLSGDQVLRDMFYDGNAAYEAGAVLCRVAPSFVRLGNFELFMARGEIDNLRTLVEWTIRTDFAHLVDPANADHALGLDVITAWFTQVCHSTADLIVEWMRVGFVHGVMNTDNLSILGLTIDYGPYGWLEGFDPNWTPNTTDAGRRRYRFGDQPSIAHWNLVQLANAIAPLFAPASSPTDGDEAAFQARVAGLQQAVDSFSSRFNDRWNAMTAERLGLIGFEGESDIELFGQLGRVLQLTETDMTIFHRLLANVDIARADSLDDATLVAPVADAWYGQPVGEAIPATATWLRSWAARVQADGRVDGVAGADRIAQMNAVNPKYVLRNWLAQLAIDRAETGDYDGITELLDLLRRPYDEQPEHHVTFFAKRPEWARERAGCSMLSCSS